MNQLLVMLFVQHLPTHSVCWEVWETDYARIEDVPPRIKGGFFTARDGVVYMMPGFPMMDSRKAVEQYAGVKDNPYNRYEVVNL